MSERKDPAESDKRILAMQLDPDAAPPALEGPPSRVEDRHGNELKTGDHVEIVYGGEYHRTTIDRISPVKTNYGVTTDHHMIDATITVHVHAAAVLKLHDASHRHDKKDAMPAAPQLPSDPHRRLIKTSVNPREHGTRADAPPDTKKGDK